MSYHHATEFCEKLFQVGEPTAIDFVDHRENSATGHGELSIHGAPRHLGSIPISDFGWWN